MLLLPLAAAKTTLGGPARGTTVPQSRTSTACGASVLPAAKRSCGSEARGKPVIWRDALMRASIMAFAYVVFSKSFSLNTSSSLILKILNVFEHMMNSKLALHTRTQIQHELEFFLIV